MASANDESCNGEYVVFAARATVEQIQSLQQRQALAQQVMASMPLRDQSNIVSVVEPPRKRGLKTADEVLDHQHLAKALAQGLVNDREQLRSTYGYCNATSSESLCSALVRLMKKDYALMEVMKGINQSNPALVANTLETLDWLVPP